jgi:hypothetical protein
VSNVPVKIGPVGPSLSKTLVTTGPEAVTVKLLDFVVITIAIVVAAVGALYAVGDRLVQGLLQEHFQRRTGISGMHVVRRQVDTIRRQVGRAGDQSGRCGLGDQQAGQRGQHAECNYHLGMLH